MTDWSKDFDKAADDFGQALEALFGAAPPRAMAEMHDVESSDAVRMGQIFGAPTTAAGVSVTQATAMRVAAVYACVRLIAGAIATLPLPVYGRTADGREKVQHDYWWLFNEQPCPSFTAAAFWEYIVAQMLLRGDGLAYLEWRGSTLLSVIPLKRDNVIIERRGKELIYFIGDAEVLGKGKYFAADQSEILHFAGMGFDGVSSMSVISHAAREAIGIAIQADRFSGKFFGAGAHVQYAVKAPGEMSVTQQNAFREAFVAAYGSGQGPTGRPLILTEGLGIEKLSMSAVDAQLLEARKWQVIDIARAFGVPPHMIGETTASTSWGSGIEQMGIGFVRYTLMPHLVRYSQELNRKLWPKRERYFMEHNVDALLEGDSKAQAEYFAKALGGPGTQGWLTVNEVRRFKNLPPIAGGDELVKAGAATEKGNDDEPTDAADDGQPEDGGAGIPGRGVGII